jgi:hypothetical protein
MKDILPLPEYEIEIPSQKLVRWISIIASQRNGTITKKGLRDLALNENLIHVETEKNDKKKNSQPICPWIKISYNRWWSGTSLMLRK